VEYVGGKCGEPIRKANLFTTGEKQQKKKEKSIAFGLGVFRG
jgi:hypothetical protein